MWWRVPLDARCLFLNQSYYLFLVANGFISGHCNVQVHLTDGWRYRSVTGKGR